MAKFVGAAGSKTYFFRFSTALPLVALAMSTQVWAEAPEVSNASAHTNSAKISEVSTSLATKHEVTSAQPELKITGGLRELSYQNKLQETWVSALDLDLEFKHQLVSHLEAHIATSLYLETGSSQAFLTRDEYVPAQTLKLTEAALDFSPPMPSGTSANFLAGALDQGVWLSPHLLSDQLSFPGAKQVFKAGSSEFGVALSAEQTIPTVISYSNRTADQANAQISTTPEFFLEDLSVYGQGSSFGASAHASVYDFENLGPSIAQQSRFCGNSVTGIGDTAAQFVYGFRGLQTGANASLALAHNRRFEIGSQYYFNSRAPDGLNTGNEASLAYSYDLFSRTLLGSQLALRHEFSLFRMESDVTPGFFSQRELGHNNRAGFDFNTLVTEAKTKTEIGLRYISAKVLDATINGFQADSQLIMLTARRAYDLM